MQSTYDTKDKVIVTSVAIHDIRFPTSLKKDGSDASITAVMTLLILVNVGPDYSGAFIILYTNIPNLKAYGMTFTSGSGNEVVCLAIETLAQRIVGKSLAELTDDMAKTWRTLVSGQIRWIGPEKGAVHMATGAIVNAIWDLWGRYEGKPVWRLVCEMPPEELVKAIDFRYIRDVLTPEEALQMLKEGQEGKDERIDDALNNMAVPAYTTSAGWLGYTDERVRELLAETVKDGFKYFKLKVGSNIEDDRRKLAVARSVIGYTDVKLMVDANQVWDVEEAIEYMKQLAEFQPWFIEEPTSPDDILGHARIRRELRRYNIGVATGEQCQNRVMWKQLFQAEAIDIAQIDACRVGGVNEVLAILLMAKKFGVPVVPHSGGVGLPEYTQHISTIDYVLISKKKSLLEYVDHLHEYFRYPTRVVNGYFTTPLEPGYSVEIFDSTIEQFVFPGGSFWVSPEAQPVIETMLQGL